MTGVALRRAAIGASLALVACVSCGGNKKKVELIYEDPVTNVWTDRGPSPAAPPPPAETNPNAAAPAPVQTAPGYPPAAPAPYPTAAPAPSQPTAYPPPAGQATQTQPAPPPGGWRNQPPPQPPPTGFPDPSATTVVVPDQNPTTQTTLKRRTGWVRGGYD